MIGSEDVSELSRCIARGAVALFPADTVYGLAADPDSPGAVERLYTLKGRPPAKSAAVMFFTLDAALECMSELGARTRSALSALTPGPVTLLLGNPLRRFPLACGADTHTLGLRVPAWPVPLAALAEMERPVLQSSANLAGERDARLLEEVPAQIRAGVELMLDGGELPGVPSSVIDLRDYERHGTWSVVREGALSSELIGRALA
jgi:L-threonylcarbamoyladenylate synthase